MGESLQTIIREFQKKQKKKKAVVWTLWILSLLLGVGVFWRFRMTGVAMTDEVYCGETDPQHIHTSLCSSDPEADVETQEEWESTLPDICTGNWKEDLLAVARSQAGYTESKENSILGEDGETLKGYSRYGAWYGNPYGDWNAMFVSFCLHYAGIPEEWVPQNSDPLTMKSTGEAMGIYRSGTNTLQIGDVVFLKQEGTMNRVGIVLDKQDTYVTVMEGDFQNMVKENQYSLEVDNLEGYLSLKAARESFDHKEETLPTPVEGKLQFPVAYKNDSLQMKISLDGEILFPVEQEEEGNDPWSAIQGEIQLVEPTENEYTKITQYLSEEQTEIPKKLTAWNLEFLYEKTLLNLQNCTVSLELTSQETAMEKQAEFFILQEQSDGTFIKLDVLDVSKKTEFLSELSVVPREEGRLILVLWEEEREQSQQLLESEPETIETIPIETAEKTETIEIPEAVQQMDGKASAVLPPTIHGEDTDSKGVIIHLFDYTAPQVNQRKRLHFNTGNGTGMNRWTGSKEPYTGMVQEKLKNGFPVLSHGGDSLKYLFDPFNTRAGVKAYPNRNKLFQLDEEGNYFFDADNNFATIIPNGVDFQQDFTLYTEPSRAWNPDSAVKAVRFLPFDPFYMDGDKEHVIVTNEKGADYHFGMTIEIPFKMAPDGVVQLPDGENQDMEFYFKGDDDVWVFLDDQLVMDMGGIHDSAEGRINFHTGKVTVNGEEQKDLWNLFHGMFAPYSKHTLKFFYMERGKFASNCAIRFNLPLKPTGCLWLEKELRPEQKENTTEFIFHVQLTPPEGSGLENSTYTVYESYQAYDQGETVVPIPGKIEIPFPTDGKISLQAGQFAVFQSLPSGTTYTITEEDPGNYAVTVKKGVIRKKNGPVVWKDEVHEMSQSGQVGIKLTDRIHFINSTSIELPHTGGHGNVFYMVTGLLLLFGSWYGFSKNVRWRERRMKGES